MGGQDLCDVRRLDAAWAGKGRVVIYHWVAWGAVGDARVDTHPGLLQVAIRWPHKPT